VEVKLGFATAARCGGLEEGCRVVGLFPEFMAYGLLLDHEAAGLDESIAQLRYAAP
jgi:hypothetical protein